MDIIAQFSSSSPNTPLLLCGGTQTANNWS